MMMLMLLGPVSSASQKGQGPLFSCLFILVGGYTLVRTWTNYLKHRRNVEIPVFSLLWVSGLSVFFIVAGVLGLLR
jgi:hypothetical protein